MKKYIEEGRKKHDESVLKEKQQQKDREKQRKEKLKVLSEETKKAAQQPLPVGLVSNKSSKERSVRSFRFKTKSKRKIDVFFFRKKNPKIPMKKNVECWNYSDRKMSSKIREKRTTTRRSNNFRSFTNVRLRLRLHLRRRHRRRRRVPSRSSNFKRLESNEKALKFSFSHRTFFFN